VVSGNFATTLKLADKERHRVAGQSDQDHHHGQAEARGFGATLGTLHLKHLRECSSTFRSRWEGPLRGRSRRIQCQHPLDPAREEGVLRQNVDENWNPFYRASVLLPQHDGEHARGLRGVAWVFAPELGCSNFSRGPLGIFPTRTRRKFPLTPLLRNLPWARPNWVRKHYGVREDPCANGEF
jgi:hypothetical protein